MLAWWNRQLPSKQRSQTTADTLATAPRSQSTTHPVFGGISTERQLRALHKSEPIAKGSEKSNPSGASFPVHRTELSYYISTNTS